MWATKLDEHLYHIENSPFFAVGVAYGDCVETAIKDDMVSFVKTVTLSGHSNYRIIPEKGISKAQFDCFWHPLEKLGCSYEHGDFGFDLYSVDVPKHTDINVVFALLENGEFNSIWDFEEGHCAHPTSR